jgi:MoxR-like ATPase
MTSARAAEQIERLQQAVETVIKGKPEAIRFAIVTLIAGGHLLVEDVPRRRQNDAGTRTRSGASL